MKKKRICFFRTNNKIGDSIISSFFIRELKKLFPKEELSLVIPSPADSLYRSNPHIDKLIVFPPMQYGIDKNNRQTPILINFRLLSALVRFLLYTWIHPYDILIADVLIHSWKNELYFRALRVKKLIYLTPKNTTLNAHSTSMYVNILTQLGASHINTAYELFLPAASVQEANDFLSKHQLANQNFIIVNPVGGEPVKNMSNAQIKCILQLLTPHIPVVLLDYKCQYATFSDRAVVCQSNHILTIAALIKQSCGVITVDTGIVHLTDVFQKSMLACYTHDKYFIENSKTVCASVNPNTSYLHSADTVADIPLDQLEQAVTQWLASLPSTAQ